MQVEDRKRARPLGVLVGVLVGVFVAASVLVAAGITRTAWFRVHDPEGTWHLRAAWASALLFPVAILLFALGIQWAWQRRPRLAVAALLPLPAWILSLHLVRMEVQPGSAPESDPIAVNANILVNDCYMALMLLQMQGIKPFGEIP